MKNNTEKTKTLLQQAFASVPDDFALAEVRMHIRAAMLKLEHVEQKRERRERAQVASLLTGTGSVMPVQPVNVKATLDYIDEMIRQEKNKIDEIHNRRKTSHYEVEEEDEDIFG